MWFADEEDDGDCGGDRRRRRHDTATHMVSHMNDADGQGTDWPRLVVIHSKEIKLSVKLAAIAVVVVVAAATAADNDR